MALKVYTLDTVTINTETDLVVPGSTITTFLTSLNICNFDSSAQANIEIKITDGANTRKAYILKSYIDAGRSLFLDNLKLALPGSATATSAYKLRVISSVANVSFVASGDEA